MNKIPLHVQKFAQGDTSFFEKFQDYMNHYRAKYEGAKNLEYDSSVKFAEKDEKMLKAYRQEIMKYAGLPLDTTFTNEVISSHPSAQWAAFAIMNYMVDIIVPDTIVDSIGVYTDIEQVGYTDTAVFNIPPRDLFVVTKASNMGKRKSEIQQQFDGTVTLTPVNHMVTVGVSLYLVLNGTHNLGEFVMKASRSIETEMSLDAYNAFDTAMGALQTTPTGGELRYTAFTQNDAVRLAQAVTAFNQGRKAMFVGTQLALSNILPNDANYRYDLESKYVEVGYIRNYQGFDLMALPQIANWKEPFKNSLDDTRIYVVSPSSNKLVKLVLGGSTIAITDGQYQNANLMQSTVLHKKWIAGVATNSVAGLIDLP